KRLCFPPAPQVASAMKTTAGRQPVLSDQTEQTSAAHEPAKHSLGAASSPPPYPTFAPESLRTRSLVENQPYSIFNGGHPERAFCASRGICIFSTTILLLNPRFRYTNRQCPNPRDHSHAFRT